jgi:hypothetical protein
MEQVKVLVSVPLEVALAAGRSRYGETTVVLDDAAVQSLSPPARALIGRDGRVLTGDSVLRLAEPEATVAATIAALERRVVDIEAQRAKEQAESEARIALALAAPNADWISGARSGEAYYTITGGPEMGQYSTTRSGSTHNRPEVDASPHGIYLTEAQKADERVVDRRAEVAARALPAATAEWERKYAEWQAVVAADDAAEAAEKARKVAAAHEARLWLAEHATTRLDAPELGRAARESRRCDATLLEVVTARVSHAVATIVEPLLNCNVLERTYGDEVRDDVPSRQAYALLDALIAAAPAIAEQSGLPHAVVEPGPIMRLDVAPKGSAVWRTGLIVEVTHPWLSQSISVPVICEPLDTDEDE